ncbi:hypothetical protein Hte_003243 [Hypoxylon texense]
MDELRKGIQELEQERDKIKQETDKLKQETDKIKQEVDKIKQERDEEREKSRKTTLEEYIAAIHNNVFSRFTVQSDPDFQSKGSIPAPTNKVCPTRLEPWSDFISKQRDALTQLHNTISTNDQVYESRLGLAAIGNMAGSRPIADEKSLESFVHSSVEYPVTIIINKLKDAQGVRDIFNLGGGIDFENHEHALSDTNPEVVAQAQSLEAAARNQPPQPLQTPSSARLRPDRICVYRSGQDSMNRSILYICEYKPPHKLTRLQLQFALRSMNVIETVVNRRTTPTEQVPEARFQYFADKLTASALTQTYNYMIQCGLEYSLLTTGEAIVFLKIDWQRPSTLYFHLADPSDEVRVHGRDGYYCTAVSQYLAFSLMVFGPPGAGTPIHTQEERLRAKDAAGHWCVDFTDTHRSIPTDDPASPPRIWSTTAYHPSIDKAVPRSPHLLRPSTLRQRPPQDVPDRHPPRNDTQDGSSECEECPYTPSPQVRSLRSDASHGASQRTRGSKRNPPSRPQTGGRENGDYCTQRCLLGLVNGTPLDERCPNAALHRRVEAGKHHPISHAEFVRLTYDQLETSLDDGVVPLYLEGARGVLFRITLLAYGYTFVGKGTIEVFIPTLQHEEAMYKHLEQNQGLDIPVYLGSVDLRSMNKIYYYDFRVYIVYIVLMSWGGVAIDSSVDMDKVRGCLRAIHNNGVAHRDVRRWNVLSDPRTDRVMVVDFERASLAELAQAVPNERPRDGSTHRPKSRDRAVVQHHMFAEDIENVEFMFSAT